jgi:hypothetical protein
LECMDLLLELLNLSAARPSMGHRRSTDKGCNSQRPEARVVIANAIAASPYYFYRYYPAYAPHPFYGPPCRRVWNGYGWSWACVRGRRVPRRSYWENAACPPKR